MGSLSVSPQWRWWRLVTPIHPMLCCLSKSCNLAQCTTPKSLPCPIGGCLALTLTLYKVLYCQCLLFTKIYSQYNMGMRFKKNNCWGSQLLTQAMWALCLYQCKQALVFVLFLTVLCQRKCWDNRDWTYFIFFFIQQDLNGHKWTMAE